MQKICTHNIVSSLTNTNKLQTLIGLLDFIKYQYLLDYFTLHPVWKLQSLTILGTQIYYN